MSHAELMIPFIKAHRHSEHVALMDDSDSLTYRQLSEAVERRAQNWQQIVTLHRPVVMMLIDNSITSVVDYLTALSLDYVVLLLNPECTLATREQYAQALMPNAVIGDGTVTLLHNEPLPTDARLSLLLSTSGSTGAGKCVALSQRNLRANCDAILKYLPIVAEDITLATLPLSYSYGLSVLHTHLKAGATICFTRHSVFDKAFWEVVKSRPVTSLAGVPSFYEMLLRLRFTRMALPALRYFTQAGGKLAEAHVTSLAEYATQTDKAFYVMYGQTEATARMAYLAPDKVLQKPGAMGQAIAGGEFKLTGANQSDGEGELCYRGDNVMLGYVADAADLAAFSPSEWLATGDLAVCDAEGDYTITGRTKRMIKVAGERVNLDTMESRFSTAKMVVRCIGSDDKLTVVALATQLDELMDYINNQQILPRRNILLGVVEDWPLLANGKVDYQRLQQILVEKTC
ncbi:MAG: AMP-binding protein [Gammaproteobacteria bacterium]|nr:AMP-binding protein [Gammaproteobacteria bacterium]